MKRITITLLLVIMLLCAPVSVLAGSFGVSPSNAEFEVPKDGSATQDFTFTGYTGTVTIGLEDIPLEVSPIGDITVTDGETVGITFSGDGTNNTYEGKITFLASTGEQALTGIKIRLTIHVNMTTEVLSPFDYGNVTAPDIALQNSVAGGQDFAGIWPLHVTIELEPDGAGKHLWLELNEDTLYAAYEIKLVCKVSADEAVVPILTEIIVDMTNRRTSIPLGAEGTYVFDEFIHLTTGSGWGKASTDFKIAISNIETSVNDVCWEKYPGNPIITYDGENHDSSVRSSSVVYVDGIYYQYYHQHLSEADPRRIHLATSSDGLNYTKSKENPILDMGINGTWDDVSISRPRIVYYDGMYWLYYTGVDDLGVGKWETGLAQSSDSTNFARITDGIGGTSKVLEVGAGGTWDDVYAQVACVLSPDASPDANWWLYYRGNDGSGHTGIGLAISADGKNFTKYEGNPIVSATQVWEGGNVNDWSTFSFEGIYRAFYRANCGFGCGIGYAESYDGINWIKYNDNPVPPYTMTGREAEYVLNPWFIFKENNPGKLGLLYYTVVSDGHNQIGVCEQLRIGDFVSRDWGIRLGTLFQTITQEIVASSTSKPGGGGGGREPTYSVKGDLFGEVETFYTNYKGEVQKTVEATSEDGNLTVTILKGTIAQGEDGKRLKTLEVAVNETPPAPPEDKNIVGLPYDFGPDGATFNPPLILTWQYDSVDPADLVIAYYDVSSGQWVELPCTVDYDNGVIVAEVAHFTTIAMLAVVEIPPTPVAPAPVVIPPAPAPIPTPAPSPPPSVITPAPVPVSPEELPIAPAPPTLLPEEPSRMPPYLMGAISILSFVILVYVAFRLIWWRETREKKKTYGSNSD